MKPTLILDNDPRPKMPKDPLIEYVNEVANKPYSQLTEEEKWRLRALLEIDHFAKEWIRYMSDDN